MRPGAATIRVLAVCLTAIAVGSTWVLMAAWEAAGPDPTVRGRLRPTQARREPLPISTAERRRQMVTERGLQTAPAWPGNAAPHGTHLGRRDSQQNLSRSEQLRSDALARGEAHSLTGRVEDDAGRAVVGAKVLITTRDRREFHWSLHRSVETDAWGHFSFDCVAAGGCKIVVIPKDRNLVVVPRWVEAPFEPAPTLIAYEGRPVSGRTLAPDGQPTSSVRVVAYLAGHREGWHALESAPDGTFRFEGLPPGQIDLWAWCKRVSETSDDGESPCDMECRLDHIEVGASDVELRLEAPGAGK